MPELSVPAKIEVSTEVAFTSLVNEAKKLGLPVSPVMGLMYLPDEKLTTQFQQACKAVLAALTPGP
jgi:hypothetical protein